MTKVSRFLRSGSCLLAGAKFKCTNCQSCYNVETLLHEPASIVMSLTVYLFALHSFSRLWYLCFFLWIAVSVQLKLMVLAVNSMRVIVEGSHTMISGWVPVTAISCGNVYTWLRTSTEMFILAGRCFHRKCSFEDCVMHVSSYIISSQEQMDRHWIILVHVVDRGTAIVHRGCSVP